MGTLSSNGDRAWRKMLAKQAKSPRSTGSLRLRLCWFLKEKRQRGWIVPLYGLTHIYVVRDEAFSPINLNANTPSAQP